jgi:hypothetical protein
MASFRYCPNRSVSDPSVARLLHGRRHVRRYLYVPASGKYATPAQPLAAAAYVTRVVFQALLGSRTCQVRSHEYGVSQSAIRPALPQSLICPAPWCISEAPSRLR